MSTTAAREFHQQMVHYLRKTVTFNDAGVGAGVKIGTLPAGAQIVGVFANITTAFNAGTTNNLPLGTTAGGSDIATTADTAAGAAGFKAATTGCALAPLATASDVFVAYTQTGTVATAGKATLVVTYAANNDQ